MKSGAKRLKTLLAFALISATLVGASAFATGTRRTETIAVTYDNIQIVVDGKVIEAKDALGNPVEPFIYNGTTYLPVRAVGSAIGKDVAWDGIKKVVYLGAVPGAGENWFDQCKPYQYSRGESYTLSENKSFTMSGKTYSDGFVLNASYTAYALFNLDGKYNSVTFTCGHIDNSYLCNSTMNIYIDGVIAFSKELKCDDVAHKINIPLNGALQMKIEIRESSGNPSWGFSEGKFE